MDNKSKLNQQSKTEYGTMTAKLDANGDYQKQAGASAANSATTSSATTSSTTSSTKKTTAPSANKTLTAKFDANDDYS